MQHVFHGSLINLIVDHEFISLVNSTSIWPKGMNMTSKGLLVDNPRLTKAFSTKFSVCIKHRVREFCIERSEI